MQKGDAMDAAERSERIPDIVIITGMSGSGRTQAMHCLLYTSPSPRDTR